MTSRLRLLVPAVLLTGNRNPAPIRSPKIPTRSHADALQSP